MILFPGGWTSAAQEASQNDGFLIGAFFRTRNLIDRTVADLQKIDREIQENDRVIKKAEEIIVLAGQRNNKQAESVARDAQLKAREARKKNEDTKARLELVRKRAAASYGALKNRLAASLGGGANPPVKGMVSSYSGRVQVSKKNGERFELRADDPGLLEAGDAILTYGSSSAEIQTLDGRGVVQLGEYSELRLQEDTPEKQVLELVRGKIYSAVDKMDDFANMLQEKAKQFGSDFQTVANVSEKEFEAVIKGLRARYARYHKRFEVHTPTSVTAPRGTRFSVELKNEETTEITVFEGSVEAGDSKGEKRVLVEEGFKVIVTKDGISGPQKITETDKWWDK
jgi:ferric-dicitrate binding protein FerR (iron transport regulator)